MSEDWMLLSGLLRCASAAVFGQHNAEMPEGCCVHLVQAWNVIAGVTRYVQCSPNHSYRRAASEMGYDCSGFLNCSLIRKGSTSIELHHFISCEMERMNREEKRKREPCANITAKIKDWMGKSASAKQRGRNDKCKAGKEEDSYWR